MADDTFEYITTDYMISVDSGITQEQPIEYIVELGEVGVQGIPGEKGDPGFSPSVNYILNNDTFTISVTNQDGVTTTPNLYDYFAGKDSLNGYLKIDGSNADNPITINDITFSKYSNYSNTIKAGDGLNLDLNNGGSILNNTRASLSLQTNGNANLSADNNINIHTSQGNVRIYSDNGKAYYGTATASNELATKGDISDATITLMQGGVTKGTFTLNGNTTTINLDAGGGTVGNPLEITNGTRTIHLGINQSNNAYMNVSNAAGSGGWGVTLLSGVTSPLKTGDFIWGLKSLSLNYDNDTLKVNEDGELYADIDTSDFVTTSSLSTTLSGYQPLLVSGTNIKTINNQSILGSGNINIEGGSGGTSDYSDLTNKPSINSVTLSGNKTANDLSLATASQGALADTAVQPGDLATVATTGDYDDLINKPTIPTNNNQLINGAGYITGITSSDVTTALGYTPYNNSNPNGYITSADLPTNYVTTNTQQTISGSKTFNTDTNFNNMIIFPSANANPVIRGMSGGNYRDIISRTNNSSVISVGNNNDTINILGSAIRPQYKNNDLALLSDVTSSQSAIIDDSQASATTTYSSNKIESLIPSLTGYATETWVTNQGYLIPSDLTNYVTNSSLATTLADYVTTVNLNTVLAGYVETSDLATVATSGRYSDLINKPTIPTTTSQLTNDSGFITGITSTDVTTALGYTPYNSTNPNGYTSNIGTVTSVNNTSPDANGNVSITIPDTSNLVTTNTEQTISSAKIFTNSAPGVSFNKISIRDSNQVVASQIYNILSSTRFVGSSAYPNINIMPYTNGKLYYGTNNTGNEIAKKSDIPIVPITDQTYNDTSTNPQSGTAVAQAISTITKNSLGLGNVDNTSDANKPISTATQTALDNKANTDLSNLTATGREAISHYALPSSRFDALTIGNSGTYYTAPADGYFYALMSPTTVNAYWMALDNAASRIISTNYMVTIGYTITAFVPAAKGETVIYSYRADGAVSAHELRFYYAMGTNS